jgi:monoamine oxidase
MLPIEKRCMAQRAVLGICTKVVLLYERAWWREAGRSGTASSAVGPIVQIMDTCDGDWNSEDPELKPRQFSLSCFIMGNFAVQWSELPPKERELAVKKHVVKLMEDEAAMDTIQVDEQQWMNEEFSMGAPVPAFGCGVITSVGREMRTPHDRVFFAGTEMAMRWKGYMDGAVEAGQTAAKDVVSLLGGLTDSSTTRPRL